jgi:uncharacterized membrane protein
MIDETQGPKPENTGQETSLGGASEWSTVSPSSYVQPATQNTAPPAANSFEQVQPASPLSSSLEPLPPPAAPAPLPPNAAASAVYQPVYGGAPVAPQPAYASTGGGYPPPPGPPPPGYSGGQYPPPGPPAPAGQGLSSNAAAAISYITFIPAVIFLVMAPYNRDRFVRFHAWQCIALTVVWVAVAIIFSVLGFAGLHFVFGLWTLTFLLIRLVLFVFWLIAIIKASQGQWYKIPIVGDLAESFAGRAG